MNIQRYVRCRECGMVKDTPGKAHQNYTKYEDQGPYWVLFDDHVAALEEAEKQIHAQHLVRDLNDIRFGREEGIREAWEAAVNVRNQSPAPFAEFVYREVLPAIDALRSRPNA